MEVDGVKAEEHDNDDQVIVPGTPDRDSDDETDAEDEPDLVPPANQRLSARLRSSSVQPSKEKEQEKEQEKEGTSGPPPPRKLPFGKKTLPRRGKASEKIPSSPVGDEDDETDDEEL